MKKKSLLLIVSLVLSFYIADAQTFKKGDGVLNLTIGFGSGLYTGGGYTSSFPPVAASFEVGVVDNVLDKGTIGVGGYIGYASAKWEASYYGGDTYGYKYTNIVIGPRGTFHYPFLDQLDTYAGLMIGYNIVSSKWTGSGSSMFGNTTATGSGLITAGFIGARYYFNEKIAGLAEIGWGVAYFNIGVAFKLM